MLKRLLSIGLILTMMTGCSLTRVDHEYVVESEKASSEDVVVEAKDDPFIGASELTAVMGTGWNLGNTLDSCDYKRYAMDRESYQVMAVYENTNWSGWDASEVKFISPKEETTLEWKIKQLNSDPEGTCGRFSFQIINNVIQNTGRSPIKINIKSASFTKSDGMIIELSSLFGSHELIIEDKVSKYVYEDLTAIDVLNQGADIIDGTLKIQLEVVGFPYISKSKIKEMKLNYYETLWGNPVTTKEMIKKVKEAGFDTIRIPVTYYDHMNEEGVIDEEWLLRVKEIVDYAYENDMYCIINVHHDTGMNAWIVADIDTIEAQKKNLDNLWQQIGNYFIDYDDRLIFEGFNEVLNLDDKWKNVGQDAYDAVNQLNQQFVDTIRSIGGNNSYRNLMVNAYAAGANKEVLEAFVMPTDQAVNHIMVGIHYYSKKAEELYSMERAFKWMNKYFLDDGIPVVVGEFASFNNWDESSSTYFVMNFMKKAKDNKVPVIWWDRGGERKTETTQTQTLLNRKDGTWYSDELLKAVFLKEE